MAHVSKGPLILLPSPLACVSLENQGSAAWSLVRSGREILWVLLNFEQTGDQGSVTAEAGTLQLNVHNNIYNWFSSSGLCVLSGASPNLCCSIRSFLAMAQLPQVFQFQIESCNQHHHRTRMEKDGKKAKEDRKGTQNETELASG